MYRVVMERGMNYREAKGLGGDKRDGVFSLNFYQDAEFRAGIGVKNFGFFEQFFDSLITGKEVSG